MSFRELSVRHRASDNFEEISPVSVRRRPLSIHRSSAEGRPMLSQPSWGLHYRINHAFEGEVNLRSLLVRIPVL